MTLYMVVGDLQLGDKKVTESRLESPAWYVEAMISMKNKDDTPPKFNIAPEKWWLEAYFPIGKVTFQGLHSGNLTWQWKIHHLKMYFLFKMGIFHCYVCLPEGMLNFRRVSQFFAYPKKRSTKDISSQSALPLQELPCSAHEMTKHRSQARFSFGGGWGGGDV